MRHRPTEPELRAVLPWLAAEQPHLYNAYQRQHGRVVENSLSRAGWLASFIGHAPGKALFVGMYEVAGARRISAEAFDRIPENRMLRTLGTRGPKDGRDVLWFDLRMSPFLSEYKGRMVIAWSGIERSWWRWAARNVLPVHAIVEESLLVRGMPDWNALVLTWRELQALPVSWKAALAQWRGIYFIFDLASGKGYVGSASGTQNLLGRWTGYAASGHGGNKLLKTCDPENLVFSILQRVSPDMEASEVVALESAWKERLHSRSPHGLNDN